jgi:hypothetical protein
LFFPDAELALGDPGKYAGLLWRTAKHGSWAHTETMKIALTGEGAGPTLVKFSRRLLTFQ